MAGRDDFDSRHLVHQPTTEQVIFSILLYTRSSSFGNRARIILSRYLDYPVVSATILWYDGFDQDLEEHDLVRGNLVETDRTLKRLFIRSLRRSRVWRAKALPFYRVDRPDRVFHDRSLPAELIEGREIAPIRFLCDGRANPVYQATDWGEVFIPHQRCWLRLLPDDVTFDAWCRSVYVSLLADIPKKLPVPGSDCSWFVSGVEVKGYFPSRARAIDGHLGTLKQGPALKRFRRHKDATEVLN